MSQKKGQIESKAITHLRFRLRTYGALHQLANTAAVSLLLMGVWVVICRWIQPGWADLNSSLGVALAIASTLATLILTFRNRESTETMAAFADRQSNAGGLLLTLNEHPDERWEPLLSERMTAGDPPRMNIDRPARRLLPAMAFYGLCLLFPSQLSDWDIAVQEIGGKTLDRVEARLDEFDLSKLLPEEEMAGLRKTLESLRKSVKKREFGATEWEAADGIQKRLREQLERVLGAAEAGLDAARTQSNGTGTAQQEALTEAIAQIDRNGLLRALPEGLKGRLLQETISAIRDNLKLRELTPEEIDALRSQMLQALEGS